MYGGSSIVKTLKWTYFHMRRMVIFEVEILASVGGFPVNVKGQCRPFRDGQNIQKRNLTLLLDFHSKLDGTPWTIDVAQELL
jgi:hypothetical protein